MAETSELKILISATNRSGAAFSQMNQQLDGLKNAAIRVGAALAGAFALKDVIDTTRRYSDEINLLVDNFGMGAEQASKFNYALKVVGSSADDFTTAVAYLNKKIVDSVPLLAKGTDDFSKWGISIMASQGQLKGTGEVLAELAAKMREAGAGQAAMGMAQDLLGKSNRNLTEFMQLTTAEMADLVKEAEDMGQVFSDAGVKDMKEFSREVNRMGLQLDGLKLQLGTFLIPILRAAMNFFRQNAGAVKSFAEALRVALGIIKGFVERLSEAWSNLKGLLGTVGATTLAADLLIIALAGIAGGPVLLAAVAVAMAIKEIGDTIAIVKDNWEIWREAAHQGLLDNQGLLGLTIKRMVEWGDAFSTFGTIARGVFDGLGTAVHAVFDGLGSWLYDFFLNISINLNQLILKINEIAHTNLPTIPGGAPVGGRGRVGGEDLGLGGGRSRYDIPGPRASLDDIYARYAALTGQEISFAYAEQIRSKGLSYGEVSAGNPFLAGGGIVTRPMAVNVGEAGPEAIIPLGRGGGGAITVNIYGDVDSSARVRELANAVSSEIMRAMNLAGNFRVPRGGLT